MIGSAGNLGRWDAWHRDLQEPIAYGDTETYRIGAEWLQGCSLIEDWGCGGGWLSTMVPTERYRGVDGSRTPYAEEIADLAEYTSDVPGIFCRHVLEHNPQWERVLSNLAASFRERAAVILFTPLQAETGIVGSTPIGVPDIAFNLRDVVGPLEAAGAACKVHSLETDTIYGVETVILAEKQAPPG